MLEPNTLLTFPPLPGPKPRHHCGRLRHRSRLRRRHRRRLRRRATPADTAAPAVSAGEIIARLAFPSTVTPVRGERRCVMVQG